MTDNSDQVAALIKELLSLTHADSAPTDHPLKRRRARTTTAQTDEDQTRTRASILPSQPLASVFDTPERSRSLIVFHRHLSKFYGI